MRVAIMQPYLFPYLGYFQLIRSADVFVVYDDVNYIKGGWINRNFIIANYLDLNPDWHISSALNKDNNLRGQDKVLAICQQLGATHYNNVPGGKALYDKKAFSRRGIQLSFVQPNTVSYRQFGKEFVPNLSIIDVMMFNDREQCAALLEEYELV
jgi:hypothetical protein